MSLPSPVEIYGQSKWEGERILNEYRNDLHSVIIRCPTIIDSGRLGLLSILFEFIHEGRKVWVVGGGRNKYQFIYAQDLADACLKSLEYDQSTTLNIGSDNVRSLARRIPARHSTKQEVSPKLARFRTRRHCWACDWPITPKFHRLAPTITR